MTFLTIARVLFDKGYGELMEASAMLQARGVAATVQWLGAIDGSYPQHVTLERIEADSRRGLVDYLGQTADVRPYVRQADCIVLPSYHEGLSRVLIEALAMSRPIITCDIPGCRETVIEGRNGYLCRPRNAASLADSMERFTRLDTEERKAMGIESRRLALERFDISHVIALYERIVRSEE